MSNLAARNVQEVRERSYTGLANRKVADPLQALEVDTCPAVQLLVTKQGFACSFILLHGHQSVQFTQALGKLEG